MAEQETKDTKDSIQEYVPSAGDVDISPDKDGGLYKEIIKEGVASGDHPLKDDTVVVHYVGTLLDGKKFDSSRDRGQEFEFEIGKGKVIRGWDIGVATMTKGEVARLTCKPEYAYGSSDTPTIPANSTLQFEVELINWRGTDISPALDGGVLKSTVTKEFTESSHPNEGAAIDIHLIGRYDGRVFEERDLSYTQGEGHEQGVVEAVEVTVLKMCKGETVRIEVSPKYGYGSVGNAQYNIPANAKLTYEITLKSFEKMKEAWEMDAGEKVEQAKVMKDKGTEKFKATKYSSANRYYKRIVSYLESEDNWEGEEQQTRDALLLAGHLNCAMCELKLGNDLEVVNACDQAISLDEKNEKAYFRRGTANMNMQNFSEATEDFEMVLKISPENVAAKNQIKMVQHKMNQQKQKEKKLYSNMFSKFAEIDSKREDVVRRQQGDTLSNVNDWDNELAKDFLPLDKEAEAFGEKVAQPKYTQQQQEVDKENTDPLHSSDIED